MKNKKFQTVILSLLFMLLFSGCGGIQDYADTPYNEEMIMRIQEDNSNVPKGDEHKEFAWQDDGEVGQEQADISVAAESEADKTETNIHENEPKDKNDSVDAKPDYTASEVRTAENSNVSGREGAVNPESDTVQKTESAPEEEKSEAEDIAEKKNICTLSVRCDSILSNMNKLTREKRPLVPENGIIYAQTEVKFKPGESVFDLLKRELQKNRIHMEFNETSAYKSAYVEGINNLYEFDCGDLSGWVYKVNGKLGSVGCSHYVLQPGDKVEWLYTCNMGRDI